jgi:hypothetical protein
MHYLLCKECVDKLGPGEEKCCGQFHPVSCDRCGKYIGYTGAHCMPQHAPPYFLASRPEGAYWAMHRETRERGLFHYNRINERRFPPTAGRDYWTFFGDEGCCPEGDFKRLYVILGPAVPPELL